MSPEAFVEKLWEERAAAILRTNDQQVAHDAMDAAVRGGFRVIEFTLGCPGPFELIEEFAKRDDLVVGAGTVLTVHDARRAVEAGARFIVSPVVDSAVIREAANMGAAALGQMLLLAGIVLFAGVVVFQVVNLPVEFDASARAKAQLVSLGIVDERDMGPVKKVLSAAAMTYVAATLQAVLTLLYYIMRYTNRR